jgi:hypothetical protein
LNDWSAVTSEPLLFGPSAATTAAEERFLAVSTAEEEFIIRADTLDHLRALLGTRGFKVADLYGEYDLAHTLRADDAVIVAVAHLE